VEEISYVIVDESIFVIYAFSTLGRQLNIQYHTYPEFLHGRSRCSSWLPPNKIIIKR